MTDLDRLIEAVEAGDDKVFRARNRAVFSTPCQSLALQLREEDCRHAYRGSLDAAKALHEALLPGWAWAEFRLSTRPKVTVGFDGIKEESQTPDLARCWLLAILKAYRAKEQSI